jgi:hypothetical protein
MEGQFGVDSLSIWGGFGVDLGWILCRFGVDLEWARSCFEAYGDVFWTLKSRQPKTPSNETFGCGVDSGSGGGSVDLRGSGSSVGLCRFGVDPCPGR